MNRVVACLASLPQIALVAALSLSPAVSLASPPHAAAPVSATPVQSRVYVPPAIVRPVVPALLQPAADPPAAQPEAAPTPPPAQLPAGVATSPTEAPVAPQLAPLPADPAPGSPVRTDPPDDPAHDRAMTFTSAGGPVCRETVPGGSLLAVAYAVVLAVLGAYVALLARKNAQLGTQLTELEDEIARRRDAKSPEPS